MRCIVIFLLLIISTTTHSGGNLERDKVILELENQNRQWIEKSEKLGFAVLDWYIQTNEVTPENLDKAFKIWKQDQSENRAPDDVVADGLGVLFGNYIIKHKIARWVVVKDSFGSDLAVSSPNGVESYPISSVWKRINPDNEEINFFEPLYTLVISEHFSSRP